MQQLFLDCTGLVSWLETIADFGVGASQSSNVGKMMEALHKGQTIDGEAVQLVFSKHVLDTVAFTVNKKGIMTQAASTKLLVMLVKSAIANGFGRYDSTQEDLHAAQKAAFGGLCDGDPEDIMMMYGATRANKHASASKTYLVSNDGGARYWAGAMKVQALSEAQALELLGIEVLARVA